MYLRVDTVPEQCYNPLARMIDTVSTKVLNENGKIDYHVFKPVLFEFPTYEYFVTGEKAGDCAKMNK